MRIVSGRFKGRSLAAPAGLDVRPTSDKVRQALFNILEHHDFDSAFHLEGARVIDLFAGTGALGIEAISRGAAQVLFVDQSADSRAALRRNVEAMGLTGISKVWRRDATRMGTRIGEAFDLAFLDPPYRKNLLLPCLNSLHEGGWLKPGALAVLETDAEEDIPSSNSFLLLEQRRYGETKLSFLRKEHDPG